MIRMRPIRVLIIDNSIFFRHELADKLASYLPKGSLLESAADPVEAREKGLLFHPDVIVTNLMMAALRLKGEPFITQMIRESKLPVILFGTINEGHAIAMREGAVGYVVRPHDMDIKESFYVNFADNIIKAAESHLAQGNTGNQDYRKKAHQGLAAGKILTRADWTPAKPTEKKPEPKILHYPSFNNSAKSSKPPPSNMPQPREDNKIKLIAIGSSTGGTEAISAVMKMLRPPLPGIVIVQHIPPTFSRLLAERLDNECALHVKEGESGERVVPNTVYIAPGGKHMTVSRTGSEMFLTCAPGPKVHSCCPSVDVLFDSVAKQIGGDAMGVILTGMGRDGASGLLSMRKQGSPTIGQDEATCVVYGMPRAAWEVGAVQQQFPLDQIAYAITKIAHG